MVPSPVPALVMRARRQVISQLTEAGATSSEAAVPLAPTRRMERNALGYLQRRDVIGKRPDGCFWVDPAKADSWQRRLRKRAAVLIGGALTVTAAVFAFTR